MLGAVGLIGGSDAFDAVLVMQSMQRSTLTLISQSITISA